MEEVEEEGEEEEEEVQHCVRSVTADQQILATAGASIVTLTKFDCDNFFIAIESCFPLIPYVAHNN